MKNKTQKETENSRDTKGAVLINLLQNEKMPIKGSDFEKRISAKKYVS